MAVDNDEEYYRKREQDARELAAAATDFQIRRIHLEMAEKYANTLELLSKPGTSRLRSGR